MLEELTRQAQDIITDGVTRAEVEAVVKRFPKPGVVEAALDHATPFRPRTMSYIVTVLEGWEHAGTLAANSKSNDPRDWMQNYNPGPSAELAERPSAAELAEIIAQVHGDDPMLAKMQRAAIRGLVAAGLVPAAEVPADILAAVPAPAQKKPAAGGVCQTTPRPAGGPSPRSAPHYSVKRCSRSTGGGKEGRGQCAPRDSNPRLPGPPFGQDASQSPPGCPPVPS